MLVGYNEQDKVFYIANSWGEEWGDKGLAEYTYDDAHKNIRDAWVVSVPAQD